MKKNAVLIAGIMFVAAGCATSESQRTSSVPIYNHPNSYDRADVRVSSSEVVERDAQQRALAPSYVDASTAVSASPASGSHGSTVSHTYSSSDVSADSTKRGGSLDARGYNQSANNDEVEGSPTPINPGKQADSSIRGGSVFARDRESTHDSQPASGGAEDRHLKADSSVRGGSVEARGAREAHGETDSSSLDSSSEIKTIDVDVKSGSDLRSSSELKTRDDFGQGSSATWPTDKAQGSVRGSANWNASDDLMRDGVKSESRNTAPYEFNNDASVGGAARSQSGSGSSSISGSSSLDLQGTSQTARESESSRTESDLNTSKQLEKNISGEINLDEQKIKNSGAKSGNQPSASLIDATASESYSSSSTSDVHHNKSALTATTQSSSDIEAAGAAAASEVGTYSSSDAEFQSNDPAMKKPGSPLGTAGGEPNFHYQDNRAHGVGSATSGEFATAPVNRNIKIAEDGDLSQRVKATLTRESSGTHGLMRHEVARNIQVSSSKGGEITLTGTVPSQKDKDMIEIRAREITGVQRVNNQLTVTPQADADQRNVSRGSDLEDVTDDLQD